MATDPARPLLNQVALVTGVKFRHRRKSAHSRSEQPAHVVVNHFS